MVKKVVLNFPTKEITARPLSSQLIRKYDIEINILKAYVDDDINGTLLFEISGDEEHLNQGMAFLRENGVQVKEVVSVVEVDRDRCVNCGACTAACVVGALEMNDKWEMVYHPDKCLECGLCLKGCPARAIHTVI